MNVCLVSQWILTSLLYIPFFLHIEAVSLVVFLPLDTGCLLESDSTLGTRVHVRQYVPDTVTDLSGLEWTDLPSRSCNDSSSTANAYPSH